MNIRISDIAKLAKVSTGTVDRVLHNRGQVSEDKRLRVEEAIKELNYKPNMVARFLASKRNYIFKVIIPMYTKDEYWELVSEGINNAVEELKNFRVSVDFIYFNQHDGVSFTHAVRQLIDAKFDGVLIATHFENEVIRLSQSLDEYEIPYVYIDTNIPNQNNIAYFGGDSFMSGAIAAKFMLQEIGIDGTIVIANMQGKSESSQILKREEGFLDYLRANNYKGEIKYINFSNQQDDVSILELSTIVEACNGKIGATIFNSRIHKFAELIAKTDISRTIKLIGYDLIKANLEMLLTDRIVYVMSQRPIAQGYNGIKALSSFLIFGDTPHKINYMPIDIMIKENATYYTIYKL